LSLRFRVALCAPVVLGVNVTASVHDCLGASVTGTAPQVPLLLAENSGSDEIALEMISELAAPVLWTVSVLVAFWPTVTLPKASEAVTVSVVVGVAVGVAVAVKVAVAVAVGVAVRVLVAVPVAVEVAVAVDVAV
jgi:hypothetical protein